MSKFNIEDYEFGGDDYLVGARLCEDEELISLDYSWESDGILFLNKEDVIALAKHFNVTAEDLSDE